MSEVNRDKERRNSYSTWEDGTVQKTQGRVGEQTEAIALESRGWCEYISSWTWKVEIISCGKGKVTQWFIQ